ncbi:MAG: response regulator [Marmoricola sp.]
MITTLLVDDIPDIRAMLRVAMQVRGTFGPAAEAASGNEAVELAGQLHPDVIVLDLGLPDLAGRDLLDRIRRSAPTSRIVVYTGADSDRAWFEERSAGFVTKSTDLDHLLDLLEQIGQTQEHSEAALEIPPERAAIREARRMTLGLLQRWGLTQLYDSAALIVTELVTNAIEHAGTSCAVSMTRSQHGVRIEVRDHGPGTPAPQAVDEDSERGRGLRIISVLSTAWGIENEGSSKTVWAELSTPAAAAGS